MIPWLLLAIFLLILVRTIYVRQSASRVARLFCLMLGLVTLWFLAFAAMIATTSPVLGAISGRIAFAAAAFMPASVYDFTSTALRLSGRRTWIIRASWGLSLVSALLILFSDVIVAPDAYRFSWGFYPRFTHPGGWAFLSLFAAILILNTIDGVYEYVQTDDRQRRRRIARLMISFLIVYAAVLDFRAAFGVDVRPIGWIPVSALIAFAWPSIRRHRFAPITAARAATDILETMADALFVLDQDGRIRVVNRAARELFGYSDADLMGRTLELLEAGEGETKIVADLQAVAASNPVRDYERVFSDSAGNRIDVSISVSSIHDPAGGGGSVVIARDVRERKQREKELHEFTERLQQSNRELEDFAHVASHDLQEPLRKIQAFGDRLSTRFGDNIPQEGLDYVARMQNAAGRMQVLINDLLSFSRITTKGRPFSPVDLSGVVTEVLHDLEVQIHGSAATVGVSELPTVDADALQMRQLFQNLIGNALKFRDPEKASRVNVTGRTEGDWAIVEVADNGIGFDQKYAERIFTIFERLHGRTSYEGTGIGLAICRKIVERHHGTIEARSESGEGTTFEIRLPLRHATTEATE